MTFYSPRRVPESNPIYSCCGLVSPAAASVRRAAVCKPSSQRSRSAEKPGEKKKPASRFSPALNPAGPAVSFCLPLRRHTRLPTGMQPSRRLSLLPEEPTNERQETSLLPA